MSLTDSIGIEVEAGVAPLSLNPSNIFGECVISFPVVLDCIDFKLLFLNREILPPVERSKRPIEP